MKLILDTLERARLAASPSDAIILADAIADLADLAGVLTTLGMTLDDAPAALNDLALIRAHVAAQPFDVTPMDDGTTVVDDLTPGAFADWIQTLESLAQ
jgi:hypothetical protein